MSLTYQKASNIKFDKENYVFSYFPCLTDKFGMEGGVSRELIKGMEDDLKNIQRLGWLEVEGQKHTPVLYIENAKEVFKHLKEWTGGDFTWFKFIWEIDNRGFYGVSLVPDMERFLHVSGYTQKDKVLQWIWSFNSKFPNFTAKRHLALSGKQKVCFGDQKTNEIVGTVLLNASKWSNLSKDSHFRRCAQSRLLGGNLR